MTTHLTAPQLAPETAWFKSSYSDSQGGSCVEMANLPGLVGVRDSKDKTGPVLTFTPQQWSAFVDFVQNHTA